MDIVVIYNGLGNQMSQYAFYLSKQLSGQKVGFVLFNTGHNGIELKKLFHISGECTLFRIIYVVFWIKRWNWADCFITYLLKLFGVHVYCENGNYAFQSVALEPSPGVTIYLGGWHNPSYFEKYSTHVKKIFEFPEIVDEYNKKIIQEATDSHAVAIHVRGGDYMKDEFYNTYGVVCNQNYYKKAMSYIESSIETPIYYVFTNDIPLTQLLFKGRQIKIIDYNKGEDAWKDMAIMSKFRSIIISNSTFSWWAAYLGRENKTVICPPYLQKGNITSDIFPKDWIRIDN